MVLQEFEADKIPVYAVMPPVKAQTAKVRRFIDLLAAQVKESHL